ncbi:transposase [candidate division LCP-89 bacterium B3_LCP]|uniref:Transposase n=1 Tax=candidate division LCP-89 bacterium B3_LCP TaxID=2012998 RepID=A0A532UU31_UNCL8|nr:MAG: transposase [candidate division LCP-89 bacterium B3_LCP]
MTRRISPNHRQSIRLRNRDYGKPGLYFLTICVKDRECVLGEVVEGEMHLSEFGKIVKTCWDDLPNHYPHIKLDDFVVMPNHVHGIIVLTDTEINDEINVGAGFAEGTLKGKPAPTRHHPLSEIIRALKTFSSRRINKIRHTPGVSFWQRNYYERVLRRGELNHYRQYIHDNPADWSTDSENPDNS